MKRLLFLLFCLSTVLCTAQTDLKVEEQNVFKNGFQMDVSYRTGFFNEWHWRPDPVAYSTGDYYRDWSMFNHCIRMEISNTFFLKKTDKHLLGLKAIWTKTGVDLFQYGGLAGVHLGIPGLGFLYAVNLTTSTGLEVYTSICPNIPLFRGRSTFGLGGELELGVSFRYKKWSFGISNAGYVASVIGGYVSGRVYGIMAGVKIGHRFGKK